MSETFGKIIEMFPEEEFLYPTGYADAVIGVDPVGMRFIISKEEMHEIDVRGGDMTMEDSIEWHEFNTFFAYMGEGTPLYVSTGEI